MKLSLWGPNFTYKNFALTNVLKHHNLSNIHIYEMFFSYSLNYSVKYFNVKSTTNFHSADYINFFFFETCLPTYYFSFPSIEHQWIILRVMFSCCLILTFLGVIFNLPAQPFILRS